MNNLKTTFSEFIVSDTEEFKWKMLNWVSRFNIFSFLDNNEAGNTEGNFICMLAVGAKRSISLHHSDLFSTLKSFHQKQPSWLFGHINYPQTEKTADGFSDGFFFEPETVIILYANHLSISADDISPDKVFEEIIGQQSTTVTSSAVKVNAQPNISKEEYLTAIRNIKNHIQRGDCYELNFCQSFTDKNANIDPVAAYVKLRQLSPNPFSALYRINDNYCLCASPERFLQKKGNRVLSQPIKGTAPRFPTDKKADALSLQQLKESEKERSENIMTVDLVRNDLSKIAVRGSVNVSALCEIHSFPQVFQMISSITCDVETDTHWTDIVEACFPMGSMTGAPKTKVMELINRYENTPRGLFSGTIGYVTPEGDFDFNVVIRSIFYQAKTHLLSFYAGGGITINSTPEAEYEETLLKLSAIKLLFDKLKD
jgi:para-aminobenzoate synthetase component 1